MASYRCFAACSFGLEALAAEDLRRLGFQGVAAGDARVYFDADETGIARANLWLRTADRVYMELARFEARSFEELFEGVKNLGWHEWLPKNARFPVAADSVNSTLKSVSDIQAISKKAIAESLKRRYKINIFPEDGAEYPLYVSIYKNTVSVAINASGKGLNRRGYRTLNAEAPLRETLAAGLVLLSRYSGNETFIDPMCGSGTIAIEAAMYALRIAPGMHRDFAFEAWNGFKNMLAMEKQQAMENVRNIELDVRASDIDEDVLKLARIHIRQAGLEKKIHINRADVGKLDLTGTKGVLVTNPPYAVRLGETKENRVLYARMGETIINSDLRCYIICADDEFERYFKKRADKKRKLYNGNIRCTLYQYFRGKHSK
jgi:putative N6-adenine-specific DNA methylase